MARRSGGLLGQGGAGRALVEAAAKRTLGVDITAEANTRDKLVEALGDVRNERRMSRRLALMALNAIGRWTNGQDAPADDRLAVAERVRSVSRQDSHMLYAKRLRNAFCFGSGITDPKANDEEVQAVLDDFWNASANQAELTSPEAQWRFGMDLWEVSNFFPLVFFDGMDGRVLLAGLQHDQVRNVVRDPDNWRRILYYQVWEYVYDWDYGLGTPKPNPRKRVVYYEAFDGFAELEEEMDAGRQAPSVVRNMPANLLRPGRVLHTAINRGREQAFGEPEMRTNMRYAASFHDLLTGQVSKARAAQQFLMKVTATGASTEEQLRNTAMTALERRSPLASSLDVLDGEGGPRDAGAALWGNEALKAEPFDLKAGSAREDLESASQAFATGTNFPGHYFFGDPGSLAGSMAVELPVLKLTEIDQTVVVRLLRKLCDLRIKRAVDVGLLSERREPTEDELAAKVEVGPDGLVDRDMTYQLAMPEVTRRNLPELMQLVVDTATTFDPMGSSEPMTRALLGYVFAELLEFPDAPALVERIFAESEVPLGGGDPASTGDPTSTGPDGKQHTSDNPYGAKRTSPSVEAAVAVLWKRLSDPTDPLAVELAERQGASNGAA